MSKSLLADSKLCKDSHLSNNVDGGNVGDWIRIKVMQYKNNRYGAGANFSAQLYRNSNNQYKIAYRGAASSNGIESIKINSEIVAVLWTAEMAESSKFTYYAIKQIQKNECDLSFDQAVKKLEVTGYSQGGFEAEFNAQLFGLSGTSIDCSGARHVKKTRGWLETKAWIKSQEPKAKIDIGVRDFIARQYTNVISGTNSHFDDVAKDRSGILIMQNAASPMMSDMAMQKDMRPLVIYELDLIIFAEMSKAAMNKVVYFINSAISDLIFKLQKSFNTAQITQGPIILDLSAESWNFIDQFPYKKINGNNNCTDKAQSLPESGNDDGILFPFEMLFANDDSATDFIDGEYCYGDDDSDEFEESEMSVGGKLVDDDKWAMSLQQCFEIICALIDSKISNESLRILRK